MAPLKLTYFSVTGLGDAVRVALAAGGLPFEDVRLAPEAIAAKKAAGEFPYGQVPVLEVDGVNYGQSNALLRYIGRQSGLYPDDDPVAAMKVDGVIDAMQDAFVLCFWKPSAEGRKTFVDEKIENCFKPIDTMVKEGGGSFVLGNEMTVADIKVYSLAKVFSGGMDLEGVPTDCLSGYKYVQKLMQGVEKNEKVAAWLKTQA